MRTAATLVAPADYAELHTEYRLFVERLVRSWGVGPDEVEDVTSSLLLKFMERDLLKEYDPERGTYFHSYLAGFVAAYIRYIVEKGHTDRHREGTSIDVVVGGSVDGGDATVYDVVAPKHYDRHEDLAYVDLVKSIRQHLAFVAPTNKNDTLNMVAVFDLMIQQEWMHGRLNVSEIAQAFSVSLAGAKKWVKRIRDEVSVVAERHR